MNSLFKFKNIFLGIILSISYFTVAVFSPIYVMKMADSHHMPMQDCIFSFGVNSLCPMNTEEHILIWQRFFNVITSSLILICAGIITFYGFIKLAKNSFNKDNLIYFKKQKEKSWSIFQNELFANGILNPKAP